MKRTLLFIGTVLMSLSASAQCSDLIISEYVEGVGNNKALEIYNASSQPIDLSQYFVARYSNGGTSHTANSPGSIAVQLTGTLQPYDVHVGVLDKRDAQGTGQNIPVWDELQALADEFYCPVYDDSYAFYFNGNDALVLYKGDINDIANQTVIDVFGKIGEDPGPGSGWSTAFPYNDESGVIVSQDHSLIRKATVTQGTNNPFPSFFDPLAEWDSIPALIEVGGNTTGNWGTLGSHSCDCAQGNVNELGNVVNVTVAPNPSEGSFTVNNISTFSSVQVINALGQEVFAVENNGQDSISIDLSERHGVYFVKLSGEGEAVTRRVLIK